MFLGIVLRDPPSAMKTLKATSRKIKKTSIEFRNLFTIL